VKRRTFFQCTGGALAAILTDPKWVFMNAALGPTEGSHVMIEEEMLRARNQNRSTVVCQHGMVCSSQPLASVAGLDVLKNGGNAIDAAVCANATLSVVEPMNCGPGGDLFAIVWIEKDQKLYGLNASGRSPYDWSIEEAGEVSGATRWQVLRYIVLPLITPGILAGSVLTFMAAFGAFSVPLIAGGNYRPLAVEIYKQIAVPIPARWSAASAIAIVMGALQVIFLSLYMRFLRRAGGPR